MNIYEQAKALALSTDPIWNVAAILWRGEKACSHWCQQ